MSRLPLIALTAALVLSVPVSASAAAYRIPVCSPVTPFFCADAAFFRTGEEPRLEIYVQICNEGLQFVKDDGEYRASADVLVVLLDGDRQVAGDSYRVRLRAEDYSATTSVDLCRSSGLDFKTPPGDYDLKLTVMDRDSRSKSTVEAEVRVEDLSSLPNLSDMVLLSDDPLGRDRRWKGYSPHPKRVFDLPSEGLAVYYEVYPGEYDSLSVVERIVDGDGGVLYRRADWVSGDKEIGVLRVLPADSLPNGRFRLEVVLEGGGEGLRRSKEFEVMSETMFLSRDLETAKDILTYIAPSGLIHSFEDAEGEERKRIWEEFWREKDPTPGTPKNEYYEEHLRRFRYANRHFTIPLAEGWRTDRGRIYILHGHPDQIDSYPQEFNRDATEIWYYMDTGRRFVFVDESGFGDYVLVREY
jgi:GWxTD domain-containing protein